MKKINTCHDCQLRCDGLGFIDRSRRRIAIRVLYSPDCVSAQVLKGNRGLKNILGPDLLLTKSEL